MVFPVVMYGCQRWTIKKVECQRIDGFKLWCWRRLLRVPWTARSSNPSILKEINPEYSLEIFMLKLQYLGHLIWRANSFEKTLMLGKIEGRRRRGWHKMVEMVGWHNQLNAHEFEQTLGDGEGQGSLACYSPWACKESDMTELLNTQSNHFHPSSVSLSHGGFQFLTYALFMKLSRALWASQAWRLFCLPFLVGEFQPPWLSLSFKGWIPTIGNQRKSSQETTSLKESQKLIKIRRPPEIKGLHALFTPYSCQRSHLRATVIKPFIKSSGRDTQFFKAEAQCVSLAWQNNKAIIFCFTSNSVSGIWFSTSVQRACAFGNTYLDYCYQALNVSFMSRQLNLSWAPESHPVF